MLPLSTRIQRVVNHAKFASELIKAPFNETVLETNLMYFQEYLEKECPIKLRVTSVLPPESRTVNVEFVVDASLTSPYRICEKKHLFKNVNADMVKRQIDLLNHVILDRFVVQLDCNAGLQKISTLSDVNNYLEYEYLFKYCGHLLPSAYIKYRSVFKNMKQQYTWYTDKWWAFGFDFLSKTNNVYMVLDNDNKFNMDNKVIKQILNDLEFENVDFEPSLIFQDKYLKHSTILNFTFTENNCTRFSYYFNQKTMKRKYPDYIYNDVSFENYCEKAPTFDEQEPNAFVFSNAIKSNGQEYFKVNHVYQGKPFKVAH